MTECQTITILKEIAELRFNDKFNMEDEYKRIVDSSLKCEYSKGGITSIFGIYSQEPLTETIVHNYRKGKLIKNSRNKYDFKYYFDDDNNLVLIEKYLSGKIYYLIFFFYKKNIKEIVMYSFSKKTIEMVAKGEYDSESKLIRYLQSEVFKEYAVSFNEQLYSYDNGSTIVINHIYSKMPNILDKVRTEKYIL